GRRWSRGCWSLAKQARLPIIAVSGPGDVQESRQKDASPNSFGTEVNLPGTVKRAARPPGGPVQPFLARIAPVGPRRAISTRWADRPPTSRGPASGASWAIVGPLLAWSLRDAVVAQGELAALGLDEARLVALDLQFSEYRRIKSGCRGL